ncbi:MAG: hypothetical protein ACRDTM_05245 [Micromonosporaceae bacterium]
MTELKDLLAVLADEARVYPVGAQALAAAHRRRSVNRYVPLAAAAVVLILVATVTLWLHGERRRSAPPAQLTVPVVTVDTRSASTERLEWLPQNIKKPEKMPPALPGTKAVDRGAVTYVYEAGQTVVPVVLTSDGKHYRLPGDLAEPPPDGADQASLSPDGRWLMMRPNHDTVVLRDLTGTVEYRVAGGYADPVWAPGGRWVVLSDDGVGYSGETQREPVVRLDLINGDALPFRLPARPAEGTYAPSLVLDTGVVGFGKDARGGEAVAYVDPVSGKQLRATRVDLSGGLMPRETAPLSRFTVAPDATTAVARVYGPAKATPGAEQMVTAVVEFDVRTGRATRRYELPDMSESAPVGWEITLAREGLLVTVGGREPLVLLADPKNGRTAKVCAVTGVFTIAVRGG